MSKFFIGSFCGFGITFITILATGIGGSMSGIAAVEMGLLVGAPLGGIGYCVYWYKRGANADKLKK